LAFSWTCLIKEVVEVAEAVVAGATAGGAVAEAEIVEAEIVEVEIVEVEIVEVAAEVAAEVATAAMVTADEEVVIGVMVIAEEEAPFEAAAVDVVAVVRVAPLLSIKVSTASLSWTPSSPSWRTPLSSVCTLRGVMIFPSRLENSPWAPRPHQALPPNTSPCALLLGPRATRSYCGLTTSRSA
jgi:hypothetical protein